MAPGLVLGLGLKIGLLSSLALGGAYALLSGTGQSGKFVCLSFSAAALAAFAYFFPIWVGMPMEPLAYQGRMWLTGPGIATWMAGQD